MTRSRALHCSLMERGWRGSAGLPGAPYTTTVHGAPWVLQLLVL